MSVVVLWENIKKDKYILEIDKNLFEQMEDFLLWKILEKEKNDEFVSKNDILNLINNKKNELKNN